MKIRAGRQVFLGDLGDCSRSEGSFVFAEVPQTIVRARFEPKQRPERPPVHHA
jgi:hypothetical protein